MPDTFHSPGWYYQQFDADPALDAPGAGYGGWRQTSLELSSRHTAIVCMHAWAQGDRDQYPGWYRAVEYLYRSDAIARDVIPVLLDAGRKSPLPVYHVVGSGSYYHPCPGYQRAVELAGDAGPAFTQAEHAEHDPVLRQLHAMRAEKSFVGAHNREDVDRAFAVMDFAPTCRPQDDEGVAENAHQLAALCRADGVNHLIYCGFAINWCLLMSPGGMLDMNRRGFMCSAVRQATTAVENRDTAPTELAKEVALWRVALAFGFVFDVDDLVRALPPA